MTQTTSNLSLSSQFTSPLQASQFHTQSQRPGNPNTDFFKKVVRESKISLSSKDQPNIVRQEQALVVRDISARIEDENAVQNFLRGFRILIKKDFYLKKALLPTELQKDGEDTNQFQIEQDSLFRLFLRVDSLQDPLVELVTEEIFKHSDDEDPQRLRLLLHQLRYLPQIKNPPLLTTKLLEVLEMSPFPSQLEIFDSLPEILPDSEHHDTAKLLTKMLEQEKEDLCGPIVDCLNSLNLSAEIRAQVQDHILSKMLVIGTSVKTFPTLMEFLMTDYDNHKLVDIFLKIRNALDTIMLTITGLEHQSQRDDDRVQVFKKLEHLTIPKRILSDTWVTLIVKNIQNHRDHKPIDLLILFMLHSCIKSKRRTIEIAIRRKVKEGTFRGLLLNKLFDSYLVKARRLLLDYFKSMVEIGYALLRSSNEPLIIGFSSSLLKLVFEHTDTTYRQDILRDVILHTGSKNSGYILQILLDLLEGHSEDIKVHTVLLMRLLNKLDNLELQDVKKVFKILCTLTCSPGDDSLSGFKQQLHMLIRKQLASCKRNLKLRGIVAAVVMVERIAVNPDTNQELNTEDSVISIENLEGRAKEAARILELASDSICSNPSSSALLGFYYDQLALMLIKRDDLDDTFLGWLTSNVNNRFLELYIPENEDNVVRNEIEHAKIFVLNSPEETEGAGSIVVDIARITLRDNALAPHFRLLRLLIYRQHSGDLSSIDALLGCGVILPKLDYEDPDDILDDFDDFDQKKHIVDCIFHCINWFREIISGFVTQKDSKLRCKILGRLDNLIQLEKIFYRVARQVPGGYKVPSCHLDPLNVNNVTVVKQSMVNTPKRPVKRMKKKAANLSATTKEDTNVETGTKKRPDMPVEINFREMDIDIVKLLKYPLSDGPITLSPDRIRLSVSQLNYILSDFVAKLSLLVQNKSLGLSNLTTVNTSLAIKDCVVILPNVSKHFETINKIIAQKLEEADHCVDAATFYTDESKDVKKCFGLMLECLQSVFSWSGFQHLTDLDLMREVLQAFLHRRDLESLQRLSAELINQLASLVEKDHCLLLNHGVSLINTMEALQSASPSPEARAKISKTARLLLSRTWYDNRGVAELGKAVSVQIDVLLKSYFSGADLKTLSGVVAKLQEPGQVAALLQKSDCLSLLRAVDKSNFYILYRNLWRILGDRLKTELQALSNSRQILELWRIVALTMQGLTNLVKLQGSRANLICFMKQSVTALKLFETQGVSLLEKMLKCDTDRVLEIFKTVQITTRYSFFVCCHSKLVKDGCLIAYVPKIRLVLETLVYKVKAALVANGCSEAFSVGNLKNRDLNGEDILSQYSDNSSVTTANENNGDEDEELPDDSDLDEDIFGGDEENSGNSTTNRKERSSSECYD